LKKKEEEEEEEGEGEEQEQESEEVPLWVGWGGVISCCTCNKNNKQTNKQPTMSGGKSKFLSKSTKEFIPDLIVFRSFMILFCVELYIYDLASLAQASFEE
jgi:hypothetical protein